MERRLIDDRKLRTKKAAQVCIIWANEPTIMAWASGNEIAAPVVTGHITSERMKGTATMH